MSSSERGRVTFCVGTGRCGTTFITELLRLEPTVAASHERLRVAACFHMFCKWHSIPVDPEGFLQDRDRLVAEDLREHVASFEASALVSHSIAELHQRFDARFILLARSPADAPWRSDLEMRLAQLRQALGPPPVPVDRGAEGVPN